MRKFIFLALVLLVPASLFAQDEGWRNRPADRDRYGWSRDNSFEFTPFAGYRFGGTISASDTNLFRRDVDLDSSVAVGASFGIPLGDQGLKLELMVDHQRTDLTTGSGLFTPDQRLGSIDVDYYHAGLKIPFARSRNAEPYVIVSGGVTRLDPRVATASGDTKFSASVGGGVRVPVNRNVGINFEGRGFFTSLNHNNNNDCTFCSVDTNRDLYQGEFNVGLSFKF